MSQPEFEILQPLEESEHALAADPGPAQEGGAGLVGARFLGAAEGEELAHRRLLAGRDDAHAGLAARRPRSPPRRAAATGSMIPVACLDALAASG